MRSEWGPKSAPTTALLNPAWWAWNEQVWHLEVEEINIVGDRADDGRLSGAFFKNRRGRVVSPPLNPHLPLTYSTPEGGRRRLDSQSRTWVSVGDQLANLLHSSGLTNGVVLPPGFIDARPFIWKGFREGLSYTYLVELPRDPTLGNAAVGKNIRKAAARGYHAERSDDWQAIWSCLAETEASKGFSHRLSLADLRLGAQLMGADAFRGYVVRNLAGHAVSGGVRLHLPGHRALDWVQGTMRPALADGVNQLMYDFVMSDLCDAGARGFDLGGANIREVALAKSSWGYPLVAQVSLEPVGALRETRRLLASSAIVRRTAHRVQGFTRGNRSRRNSGGTSCEALI